MADCLFCNIVNGDVPSTKVYEDNNVYAFRDISPQAPTHVVIVPKEHFASLKEVDNEAILGKLLMSAQKIAKQEGLDDDGYRVVINTGKDGGQTVDHLHLHLLGGRYLEWPPG